MRARHSLLLLLPLAAACAGEALRAAQQGQRKGPETRLAYTQPLPGLDGQRLVVKIVEVTYAPGAASTPHRHPCPVIGYVIEGALRSQVKGRPDTLYRAGESFFEGPDDVHLGARSASDERPVRFLAYFTCDRETPLSVPVATP